MNHADVRNRMADYLEGDLSLGTRALVDAHLDACAECDAEIAELRQTVALLRAMPEPEVPRDFASQVMRRVRSGDERRGLVDGLRAFAELLFSPRVLAPVSVAMLAAGLLIGTGGIDIVIPGFGLPSAAATRKGIALEQTRPESQSIGASAASEGQTRGSLHATQPHLIVMGSGPRRETQALGSGLDSSRATSRARDPRGNTALPVAKSGGPELQRGLVASRMLQSSPRTAVGIADSESGRLVPTADEWLAHLERNPADFADRLAVLSLAEHELWVDTLARHAVAQDRLDAILHALNSSASQRARLLAADFAAAGQGAPASAEGSSRN